MRGPVQRIEEEDAIRETRRKRSRMRLRRNRIKIKGLEESVWYGSKKSKNRGWVETEDEDGSKEGGQTYGTYECSV